MQASSAPTKVPLPFANAGARNTIPTASQIGVTPGAASLTDGFPPLTRTPIAAGGIPPSGQDMNGILFLLSANIQWENAGAFMTYDAAFSASIGGYPKGALLAKAANNGFWLNQVDNNATNPDSGGANWIDPFAGRLVNVQIFTSTGTYTRAPGVTAQLVIAVGGGGSGAGTPVTGASQCAVGGPGGSGAYAEVYFATPIPSGTTITIGAGGAPANGGGSNGGTTSVGSAITCPGGRVGTGAGPSAPPLLTGGGNGATGFATQSGGQPILLTSGKPAQLTFALGLGTTAIGASPGADGPWGGGGVGASGNTPGNAGTAPGAGGSGCVTNGSQASIAGGAGVSGRVIIYEFGSF